MATLRTRPRRFDGKSLLLNYSTSAGGSLRLVGDSIEQALSWADGSRLDTLVGKSVRLRFALQEANLFSLQFRS